MFESEDGTVTGSIDRSRLGEVKPKTDEARAQIGALKAETELSDRQSAEAAERAAELARRQNPNVIATEDERKRSQREQKPQTVQSEPDKSVAHQQGQEAAGDQQELTQLRAEAEQAGVTVDKRWGADRLRQEIDAAKAAQARKRG